MINKVVMSNITKCSVVFLIAGMTWIACNVVRVESLHFRLLGEFNRDDFSFYVKWPKNSGARIRIGTVEEALSGKVEFNISKGGDILFSVEHDIGSKDKSIILGGKGVHGYEVALIPKGVLNDGETYLVSGVYKGGGLKRGYSMWLCYLAPWISQ